MKAKIRIEYELDISLMEALPMLKDTKKLMEFLQKSEVKPEVWIKHQQ